jgi:hypothetical protein
MSSRDSGAWNYRMLRHPDGRLAVHEVFFDDDGRPWAATKDPISFEADADESLDDLADDLEHALAAVRSAPVLDWSDIPPREGDA